MVPNLIVIDPDLVHGDGTPVSGAQIFATCIKVHPSEVDKVHAGLVGMFGDLFTVIEMKDMKGREPSELN
jgi:hypothetical protein